MNDQNDFYHPQLNKKVSEHIRGAILQGDLQPGAWIRQKHIADELGVSQMPVREALKHLAAEGLVEHIPYRGVRVVTFSIEDVADLYAQRAYLEGRAAKAAAKCIAATELDLLSDLQTQMEENLGTQNILTYRELNRRFHQTIYRCSQRRYLIRTLDQLWLNFPNMLFTNFLQTSQQPLPRKEAKDIEEHRKIVSALQMGQADEAERITMQHILASGDALIALLSQEH